MYKMFLIFISSALLLMNGKIYSQAAVTQDLSTSFPYKTPDGNTYQMSDNHAVTYYRNYCDSNTYSYVAKNESFNYFVANGKGSKLQKKLFFTQEEKNIVGYVQNKTGYRVLDKISQGSDEDRLAYFYAALFLLSYTDPDILGNTNITGFSTNTFNNNYIKTDREVNQKFLESIMLKYMIHLGLHNDDNANYKFLANENGSAPIFDIEIRADATDMSKLISWHTKIKEKMVEILPTEGAKFQLEFFLKKFFNVMRLGNPCSPNQGEVLIDLP